MRFKVRKTLRVPVPEPTRVGVHAGRAPRSLERWIQRPENVMETVFSKEGVVPLETETEWRISVIKLPFLDWELNPEFDLRISEDAAVREHGVRMVSDALRFAPEGGLEKLPPGFAGMDIWSHIDCELFIERTDVNDVNGGDSASASNTAVCADIDLLIAADIPGVFRWIPFFEGIGESAISGPSSPWGSSRRPTCSPRTSNGRRFETRRWRTRRRRRRCDGGNSGRGSGRAGIFFTFGNSIRARGAPAV
jgi:hypothetical protein